MRTFLGPAVVVAALQACVGDSPTGESGAATGTDGGAGGGLVDGSTEASRALSLSIAPVEIVRGQPATFVATLEWNGEPADVTLTVVGPPGTTSSGPVTVPRNATSQSFTLGTDVALSYGDQTVQVTASTPALSAVQTTAKLFVRGTPGSLDTSFGDGGRATPPPGEPLVGTIVAESDGRFYATGLSPAGVLIVRYGADGRFDPTFAANGVGTCVAPTGMSIGSFLYPWTSQRVGASYQLAYGFLKAGPGATRFPMMLTQPEQGQCSVSPSPPPAAIPSGDGIPQAGGVIWVSDGAQGIAHYDAQGALDPVWAGGKYVVIPPEAAAATDVYVNVASASSTRLLLSGRASQGGTDVWRGYALLDRATGQQITRFASASTGKLGVGTASDGTSYLFLEGASFLRVDPSGNQTTATSSFYVSEAETRVFGTIAFTSDDSPVLLMTDSGTQLERVVLLDKSLAATQPTVNLEAPMVATQTMYARGAIVDARRRIIVLHTYDDDAQDPSIVSVHWMIRRYWL